MRPLRILTWHVHGNYLWNLSQVPHEFWLVTDAARSPHHAGRSGVLPWPDNLREVRVEDLRELEVDLVLYQHRAQWDRDRLERLSPAQRARPRIVLEHDPPQEHPTDTRHWCSVDDGPDAPVGPEFADGLTTLVHCTHFNALMWDNGAVPVRVVEHGVKPLAEPPWSGELERGLVVVNHLAQRGRRLGLDVFLELRERVPLHLVGMASTDVGGAGEVPQFELPHVMAAHRFFFNPIRHTSLGLAVVEALHAGLPVVGLATTELASVIDSGTNGYVDTRLDRLVGVMRELLRDRDLARRWGEAGHELARERFGIGRFVDDWCAVLDDAAARAPQRVPTQAMR